MSWLACGPQNRTVRILNDTKMAVTLGECSGEVDLAAGQAKLVRPGHACNVYGPSGVADNGILGKARVRGPYWGCLFLEDDPDVPNGGESEIGTLLISSASRETPIEVCHRSTFRAAPELEA